MKLVKFMGLAVLDLEAPLSTQGAGSDVLKGLPALLCPLSPCLGSLGQVLVTTALPALAAVLGT